METMYEKVRAILAKQLRVDAAIVTLDAQIKKDLGADSLDILQLLMRIEDQYGIVIPDKALATFNTVGDVVTYLEQEGTALELLKKLKKDIYSRTLYKLGALLMKRMFLEEKEFMNYQNYGGSVLLGTSKVVVKGHGSSKAVAVEKCIEQAYRMEVSHLSGKIEEAVARYEHYED